MFPPNGLTNILHFYGAEKFDSGGHVIVPNGWAQKEISSCVLPSAMRSDAEYKGTILLHNALHGSFQRILHDLLLNHKASYYALNFAGSYVPRMKRGLNEPSLHALGIALDFNANEFPLRRGEPYHYDDLPSWYKPVVDAFHKEHWKWGGDFGDGMHFQAATGY